MHSSTSSVIHAAKPTRATNIQISIKNKTNYIYKAQKADHANSHIFSLVSVLSHKMIQDLTIGRNLLLKGVPDNKKTRAKRTLESRSDTYYELIKNIKAARVDHDNKKRSLPGIGHEFWQNKHDHMRRYIMPPAIHMKLINNKETPTQREFQEYKKLNREIWKNSTDDMYTLLHEQSELLETTNKLPIIRIPTIRTDRQDIYIKMDNPSYHIIRIWHSTAPEKC